MRDQTLEANRPAVSLALVARAGAVVVTIIGWIAIFHINRWHFGPPVIVLWFGWLGVVLTAKYLWTTGLTAADDGGAGDAEAAREFWRPIGRHDELLLEKKALLKAIKEIEFDHEMGKMSAQDAEALSRYYRHRAIEIIKVLEEGDEGGESGGDRAEALPIREQIEREVKARRQVAGTKAKAKAKAKVKAKADEATVKSAEQAKAGDAESDDAKSDDAKSEQVKVDEAKAEAKASAEDEAEVEAKANDESSATDEDAGDESEDAEEAEAQS